MSKTRILGIDYGTKRVGIAVSDENAEFALPKCVLKNSTSGAATTPVIEEIKKIANENQVSEIVIGESKNYKGEDNKIMDAVRDFALGLGKVTGLPVHFEPEFMTSVAAERFQGKSAETDASAAALILQSFLDKRRQSR